MILIGKASNSNLFTQVFIVQYLKNKKRDRFALYRYVKSTSFLLLNLKIEKNKIKSEATDFLVASLFFWLLLNEADPFY